MTHQEIIDLAKAEGLSFIPEANSPLVRIVQKAVARTREECAQVCDAFDTGRRLATDHKAQKMAAAIRARGAA